jgi:hypothetical protein
METVMTISTKSKAIENPTRRSFLKGSAAAALAAAMPTGATVAVAQEAARPGALPPGKRFIGIQVGAVSFVDEGVDRVLDILQERAGVNALMLAVFTYGRGIAGRQVPGQPLPDHGAQQYDRDSFHGGDYATLHPQFYAQSVFKNFRAPDLGDFDLLATVVPKARARNIKSFCWFEDVYSPRLLDNFEKVAEVDVDGRPTGQACLNNPYLREFLASLIEDWTKSYNVDGIMWGSERQGPLNRAIGANHGGFKGPGAPSCFCRYCAQKGAERGIKVERARQGLQALRQWVHSARTEPRPSDGYFVTFWRLLLNYPEILAWEQLWTDSQHEVYGLIYGTTKAINPQLQVGFHVWHVNSFSPFYRAEQDYSRLRQTSDFLKVVMYNNCAGPRLAEYIRNIQSTVFRDSTPEDVLRLHYDILGYKGEASLDKLPTTGLSADYVARETRRALAGVQGQTAIYPGIDIDVPTGEKEKKTHPSDVRDAVKAALTAGAPGVILSRKYSEMKLENLSVAGEALRDLHLA